MGKYYDGTKLLSMLDLNGNKPEIYMCTTNRTGGKTTYFARLCVNKKSFVWFIGIIMNWMIALKSSTKIFLVYSSRVQL